MKKLTNLQETTYQTEKPTIDREAGVIRGVKILGATSKNGRDYSPQAMREAASMYEGLGVNTDHPSKSTPNVARTVEEGVGWLENVTVKPEGVFGDLHIIKSHRMANSLFEVAERKPDRFGLSHNASGECVERNRRQIVESVKAVRSVDLVQNPATNHSLFESEEPVAKTTFLKLLEAVPAKSKEHKALSLLLEMDGVTPDMPVDIPVDAAGAPATDTDSQVRAAFKAAIGSLLDDSSIAIPDLLVRIEALLNSQAAALGVDIEAGEGEPGGDTAVAESVLQKRVEKLEGLLLEATEEKTVRGLLEAAQLEVTDKRLAVLKAVKGQTRTDLIEEWKQIPTKFSVKRPLRSPPAALLEGVDDVPDYKPPVGKDAMLAAYK